MVLMGGQLHAQYTTTFAKNVTPGQHSGLYYALPQTMLKLDFIIEETTLEKSPLSDYASNYMEMADYVEYETTEYRLLDMKMSTVASPDPNAMFFVTLGSVRGGSKMQFDITPNGIIRSVGLDMSNGTEEVGEAPAKKPCCEQQPVDYSDHKLMNLITTGKSNAQMAKEAADKIEEIRKAKFYLISGDVEMATNPETVPTQTVAKFSENDGLTIGTAGSGALITVQTLPMNTTESINAPSQSAVESMSYENKVFYRLPETANVKVMCGNKTLFEDRMVVNQLGALLTAPLTNTKLVFDTETGQIVNMRMQ